MNQLPFTTALLVRIVTIALVANCAIYLFTKISKKNKVATFSPADFAIAIIIGLLIAEMIIGDYSILKGCVGLATVLIVQFGIVKFLKLREQNKK